MLAVTSLRPELLGDPESYIPFRSMARVIERAAAQLDCPDFALRLAARQNIEILGPIALIARHSRTTREALEGIAQHMSNYSPALRIGLAPGGGPNTRYTFDVLVSGLLSHPQVYQLGLGVSLGILRLLVGAGFHPLLVTIPHARPTHSQLYERFFGCRVRFDADRAGMLVPTGELDRQRATHDPLVREHVARYLDDEGPADDDLVAKVRHLISRTLAVGQANSRTVAAHLGLHPRTFQRWLATDSQTFERLLDEVRREKAIGYLTRSSVSLDRIATLLGYSHQSCLSRASVRWFDTSPSAVRAAAAADRVWPAY